MRDPSLDTRGVEHNTPPPLRSFTNRAQRRAAQRGSRAHVSRMAGRRKAIPSLGTVLAVRRPDGTIARISLIERTEVKGAHPVEDADQGRER